MSRPPCGSARACGAIVVEPAEIVASDSTVATQAPQRGDDVGHRTAGVRALPALGERQHRGLLERGLEFVLVDHELGADLACAEPAGSNPAANRLGSRPVRLAASGTVSISLPSTTWIAGVRTARACRRGAADERRG